MIKKKTTGNRAGQWQVRIQPINPVTKKRESWPVEYAKTKSEAVSLERKMWADYENGINLGDGNSIFVEELEKYVNNRRDMISLVTQKDFL